MSDQGPPEEHGRRDWPHCPAYGQSGSGWTAPTGPAAPAGPTGPAAQSSGPHPPPAVPPGPGMPPVPQAPHGGGDSETPPPLGQSPYGRPVVAPSSTPAQASYGSFTFPAMARQRVEPTAVASVVTSPLGLVGLVLGLIGKRRVRTKQRRSRALAYTGIGLSGLFLIVWILVGIVLIGNGTVARWTESPQPGDVQEAHTVGASNVALGNCIEFLPPGQSVAEVQLVPCTEPHVAQVISVHDLDGDFPGSPALAEQAESTCTADVSALDTDAEVAVASWYFTPTEEAWQEGTHRFVCLARSDAGTLERSLLHH